MPSKGDNWFAIQKTCQNIASTLGFKRLILKGDQEPALQTLLDRISRLADRRIIQERSPVGESQSNGIIERAIQELEGQVRAIKLNLEEVQDVVLRPVNLSAQSLKVLEGGTGRDESCDWHLFLSLLKLWSLLDVHELFNSVEEE